MNQNINTSLFIHVTPPQCSQEMLRPIHIGNKCSVAPEWTGRQSVLTHRYLFRCLHDGQTTGCPPVALITARWCPCCPVVCPKYVYVGHCMYWLGMTKNLMFRLTWPIFTCAMLASMGISCHHVSVQDHLSVSVCRPSIHLSQVWDQCFTEMAKCGIMQTTPHDSPGLSFSSAENCSKNQTESPPTEAPNAGGMH